MSTAWYRSACATNTPHARAFRTTVGGGGTIETSERDHHGRNIRSEKGRQVRAHHEGQAAATSAARRQQEVIRRNCPRASVFSSHVGSSVCRSATDLNQPERSGGTYRRRTVSAITPTSPVRGRRGRWRTPWARAVTPSGMFGPANPEPTAGDGAALATPEPIPRAANPSAPAAAALIAMDFNILQPLLTCRTHDCGSPRRSRVGGSVRFRLPPNMLGLLIKSGLCGRFVCLGPAAEMPGVASTQPTG